MSRTPKKISSGMTVFTKRVFPAIWFGFLLFFAFTALSSQSQQSGDFIFTLFSLIFMAAIGVFVFKKLVFGMLDEVYDHGDYLVLKNGSREARVQIQQILNVNYSANNPPSITLLLRENTTFGNEVSFFAPASFSMSKTPPLARDLIERVEKARTASR